MNSVRDTCDTLIIGGGVIGLSIAWRIAQAGRRVTIVERGECGREASCAASGIIESGSAARTDPLAILRRASVERWPAFAAELLSGTGIDPQFIPCGSLDLITDDNQDAAADREVAAAAGRTTPAGEPLFERLSAAQVHRVQPGVTTEIRGALLKRGTSQVRSPRLMAALRVACERTGVRVIEHAPVLRFVLDTDGAADAPVPARRRVVGVKTPVGMLRAQHIILAAGAWSSQLDEALRPAVDIHPARGQIVQLELHPAPLRHIIEVGSRYIIARPDGLVLVGSTVEHDAGFDKRNTASAIAGLIEFAQRIVPALKSAAFVRSWSGLRPAAHDHRPVLGPVPDFDGLIAATGHYRSGLVLAPITAEVLVRMLSDQPCSLDLTSFTPGRTDQTGTAVLEP